MPAVASSSCRRLSASAGLVDLANCATKETSACSRKQSRWECAAAGYGIRVNTAHWGDRHADLDEDTSVLRSQRAPILTRWSRPGAVREG